MNGSRENDDRILGQGVCKVDKMDVLLWEGDEKVVLQ